MSGGGRDGARAGGVLAGIWPRRAGLWRDFRKLRGTLFIVTYGRSGSTLLQNLMMTIPGCTIRGENHGMVELLWWAEARARRTRDEFTRLGVEASQPWFGADQIRPEGFADALVRGFVHEVLVPPRDTRWFGFKEIRYSGVGERLDSLLDFMRAHFPNAHFIFNGREAEAVARSRWWRKRDPGEVMEMVRTMDARFERYATAHPECCFRTRYEAFTEDPDVLRPIFARLGEPFDPVAIRAVLDHRLTH